jgi:hypothetical protein
VDGPIWTPYTRYGYIYIDFRKRSQMDHAHGEAGFLPLLIGRISWMAYLCNQTYLVWNQIALNLRRNSAIATFLLSRRLLQFCAFPSQAPVQSSLARILDMDAHARSLLELLNTSASRKVSKSSTSGTETVATPVPTDVVTSGVPGQVIQISPQTQRPIHATLEEPEATMSVKDLLVSARQRSREDSPAPSAHSKDNADSSGLHSSETAVLHSPTFVDPPRAKEDCNVMVNTSDCYASVNQEEIPTTPGGSNNSSLVSNCTGGSHNMPETSHLSRFQGVRIVNDVPSIVTLPPMKTDIPRLQITTDSSGRAFPGEGIEQIANLARAFGVYDREIISATTKYIVYALKGMLSINCDNRRWTNSHYRPEYRDQSDCRNSII